MINFTENCEEDEKFNTTQVYYLLSDKPLGRGEREVIINNTKTRNYQKIRSNFFWPQDQIKMLL